MRFLRLFFLLLVVVAIVAGGWYYVSHMQNGASGAAVTTASPYVVPPLTQNYKNDTYRFSLTMPADFTASDAPGDTAGDTIVLQNKTGDGIQITISPWDEPASNLTVDRIKQDIPDMTVDDVQPLQVGDTSTGLAFRSNNDSFGGASREVWFVFNGNLYQISTYDRLDDLLKSIFATWQFF